MVSLLRHETSEKGKLNLLKITYLDYRMVFFLLKYRLRNINVCSQLLFLCKQLSLRGNSTNKDAIRYNENYFNKQRVSNSILAFTGKSDFQFSSFKI